MTGTVPNDPAADVAAVPDLLTGSWVAQILRAVAQLRIADHLTDNPATAEEVAAQAGSDPQTTYRLMRAASSLGVLSYERDRRFGRRILHSGTRSRLRRQQPPTAGADASATTSGNFRQQQLQFRQQQLQ
jgi:hypothetical protein